MSSWLATPDQGQEARVLVAKSFSWLVLKPIHEAYKWLPEGRWGEGDGNVGSGGERKGRG